MFNLFWVCKDRLILLIKGYFAPKNQIFNALLFNKMAFCIVEIAISAVLLVFGEGFQYRTVIVVDMVAAEHA